jgi:hypothetical protein
MTSEFSLQLSGFSLPEGPAEIVGLPKSYRINPSTETYSGFSDEVLPAIKGIKPGEYILLRDKFSDVSQNGLTTSFHELTEDEETNALSLTRRRNSHGLLFGQIVMQSERDKQKASLAVIKPFDSPKAALREFSATDYVNSFSKRSRAMQSLEPLGFYRFDTGDVGLITTYEHSVISYDNMFWDNETDPTELQLQKAMGRIAVALGRIHLMGITHGDAQVKNFATDNQGIRLIDLESADGFPASGVEFNEELVASRISNDIDTFVNSLNTGIEDYDEHRDYRKALVSWFIPRYVSVA